MIRQPATGIAIVAGVAALGLGIVSARRLPWLAPLVVVAGLGLPLAITALAVNGDTARAGALGYANASAALCVAAGAGGLYLYISLPAPWLRRLALTATLLLLVMPVWFRSRAAVAGALLVLSGLSPAVRRLGARRLAPFGGLLVAATSVATVVIGWLWRPGSDDFRSRLAEAMVAGRAELWHDALERLRRHPLTGAGSFGGTGSSTADFQNFAHSLLLHAGAVAGTFAIAALVAATVAAYMGLARRDTTAAVVACLAFTALGVQASVDYVGHFALVVAAFAALVGSGLSASDQLRREDPS